MTELNQQQINAIEAIIKSRMDNTDESREEACRLIVEYLAKR